VRREGATHCARGGRAPQTNGIVPVQSVSENEAATLAFSSSSSSAKTKKIENEDDDEEKGWKVNFQTRS
jgi:hypothetical protein